LLVDWHCARWNSREPCLQHPLQVETQNLLGLFGVKSSN
jgi:hypothetical protein